MPASRLPFSKMHGLQNDYVVVDAQRAVPAEVPALTRSLADRRTGVGCDGLLLVLPSEVADLRMRMFNPDGSEAEMCGNGLRCFALFAATHGLVADSGAMRVETGAGVLPVRVGADAEGRASITVDMGVPHVAEPLSIDVEGETLALQRVSMGNPHAVLFVADVDAARVGTVGPQIETNPAFPDRTNVEFVQVVGEDEVRQRTWERGAGETLACGTGACAVAVAGAATGRTGRDVRVRLRGGDLQIRLRADDHVEMTGPAVLVFDGFWPQS